MAPPTENDEPKFRFVVKIMPPRRPANSLFRRALQQPKPEEPLHIIAVPARASETFADVWKNIKERYERNYTAEEVAKGWFHKLQDRYGADIDSHDGVGELGYTVNSHRDDLVLIMLQNDINRDGSVPENSGLRPPGFSRPEMTAEQEQEAKRRKLEEERYGGALEDIDENTPIESRERSLGPGSPEPGGQGDSARKIDADGFAVPALPGSVSRKRKRSNKTHGDVIQSSMEGENEDDMLVEDSQTRPGEEEIVTDSVPDTTGISRARTMQSVPAEATAGALSTDAKASRAQTTAPKAPKARLGSLTQGTLQLAKSAPSHAGSSKSQPNPNSRQSQQRSPPTPVSTTSQPFTQPPESAQRPKHTPTVYSTPANQKAQHEPAQDSLDFDPIEDDDLLQGITGTADNSFTETDIGQTDQTGTSVSSTQTAAKSGNLPKPGKLKKLAKSTQMLASTPNASASSSKKHAFTPINNALERLSGTQGSAGKNPRSQSGQKLNFWTSEEDSYLLQGLRQGLSAPEIIRRFELETRTSSAVRGRLNLLRKDPKNAKLKGVSEAPDDEDQSASSTSKRRKPWSVDEVRIMSRAIANGLDALEIQAQHFPQRSEDSINRKVIAIQDNVWKNASKDPMFPENGANLEGWTLKDSCKLWRTNREGLLTKDAKQRFFSRWQLWEVQKQLDAYKAKLQRLASEQARASQANQSAKDFLDSSQLLAESSQLPANSSPVERSMQARAARHSSVEPPQAVPIQVPSSPPQSIGNGPASVQPQQQMQSHDQGRRGSSPTVRITTTEQNTARSTFPRPSSGHGKQSTLNFSRDKGKQRVGAPRPTFEELDSQYTRHSTATSADRPSTQPQRHPFVVVSQGEDHQVDHDDDHEPTPLDDLEMLDADVGNDAVKSPETKGSQKGPTEVSHTQSTPVGSNATSKAHASSSKALQNNESTAAVPVETSPASSEGRRTRSSGLTMQSPIMNREGTASTSSWSRRRSRVETGVDTRVAAQLSQELNRSLSREEMEEASHENQVMHTPDPKIKRYRKTPLSHKTAPLSQDAIAQKDYAVAHEAHASQTQTFQTQDPTATRSQRASRAVIRAEHAADNISDQHAESPKPTVLQPSPQLDAPNHGSTPATMSATTPATSGKLPARGQSYASKIRNIHRGAQPAVAGDLKAANEPTKELSGGETNQPTQTNRSPPPTDAEIWAKTANAESLGRNRQEYFEDLKISTYSIRAMGRADWEEVKRLKAEERRLHRQRKIAKGTYVPSARDTQHPDGPAQGGNTEQADEDVIRADDDSNASSDEDDMGLDEEIWSDADSEQPEELDRDRHFSEVEDDDEATEPHGNMIEVPQDVDHNRHFSEVKDDEEMHDVGVEDAPQVNGSDAVSNHADDAEQDDLELPTLATMPDMNADTRHALTDEHLQELNNSGEEGSPTRLSRKRKAHDESSPEFKRSKLDSDRVAMPPPQSTGSAKRASKRKDRRRRSYQRRNSESGSDRRSSFSFHQPSSDAAGVVDEAVEQSTTAKDSSKLAEVSPSAHRSKRAKVDEPTPVKATPKVSQKTPNQPTDAPAAAARQPSAWNTVNGTQKSNVGGGGLSGLVRKAHIPTPPKAKAAAQKESKSKKFDIRADDDESDESESSE